MAAVANFIGGETGGLEEWDSTSSAFAIDSSISGRTGNHAFKYSVQTVDTASYWTSGDSAFDTVITGFRFQYTATPTANIEQYLFSCGVGASGSSNVRLLLVTDGSSNVTLKCQDSPDSPSEDSGTTQLSADTWYYIELYYKLDDAPNGFVYVYLDGSEECSLTGVDTYRTSTTRKSFQAPKNVLFNTPYYIDDFYHLTGVTAATDRLGAVEVYGHKITAANHVPADDQEPEYNGVTYGPTNLDTGKWEDTGVFTTTNSAVYSAGNAGGADEVDLDAGITQDPVALKGLWYAKKTAGDTVVAHYGVYGNSSDDVTRTADIDPGTSYALFESVTESASIVPTASEKLRIGFEVEE